ncbi:MAG: iron chelate uptake ABC transporter family permease subunit, partial [Candidatus Omnitrophica bacterium]|nr:iron chelate uptake ABC transporter family permease subunit [Candidatus Omnitrophota bacterium]
NVEAMKKSTYILASLITGAVVSVSGLIGFIGLVVPHIARMLFGPDHRLVIPASACIGGMLLVIADTIARTMIAPQEIPVGVITSFLGAPFFIYLLKRKESRSIF